MDIFNRNNHRTEDDHFSNLMFGSRKAEPEKDELKEGESSVDYLKLMQSVETLMGLYGQYKPAIEKLNLSPMIDKFLKKE
ncbi:hypothetical protein AS888_23030 [Peribacillus simplex]|uniref:Uncharacterized protein n=1 Tax=Peribacillus simplex TaxID=1478 RepID=A0A120GP00_9BACI|nr:hypothetical protein [Peribacillus simplex]KWW16863.1 hypothetical protein AS888_23030 [Peribacillus simplex]